MPTDRQIYEHTTPRWPLVRFTDEEIAEDGSDAEALAPLTLGDGEMVALKVLLVAWISINAERDDMTVQERRLTGAASSSLGKISNALNAFLPSPESD